MRIFTLFFTLILSSSLCWADAAAYEEAVLKIQKFTFGRDMPNMARAVASTMGGSLSSDDNAAILEVMSSPELALIHRKNLEKVFSESEVIAIAAMMESPTYRMYLEKMPLFIQGYGPEVTAFWMRTIPEIQKRIAEKKKHPLKQ